MKAHPELENKDTDTDDELEIKGIVNLLKKLNYAFETGFCFQNFIFW